jgi:two-component system phosphate regulon response regulator PhoB
MSAKVLVVDDERAIRDATGFALSKAGIAYDVATNAKEAKQVIEQSGADLVLLDWMLPDTPGIKLAQWLKSNPNTASVPIIMLTARGEEEDKVRGLEVGADDYITKPFSPKELIARIRAVLRRSGGRTIDVIQLGGLVLDASSYRVHVMGAEVELSNTEFELLHVLMSAPDRVFTRAQLLDLAWPRTAYVGERTVDVHISSLRKALEPLGAADRIETVRGVGYRFAARHGASA